MPGDCGICRPAGIRFGGRGAEKSRKSDRLTLRVECPSVPDYRFFRSRNLPVRYTWLPKAALGVAEDLCVFHSHEDDAMVSSGGKNMVRSMRFWAEARGSLLPGAMAATK